MSGEELHGACTDTTFATSHASLASWQYSPVSVCERQWLPLDDSHPQYCQPPYEQR